MAVQLRQLMSIDEFDTWLQGQSASYEYIGGEALPVVSNNYCSQIAMLIGAFMTLFVVRNQLGHVTGADGGYVVQGERYIPDVGFIGRARQPEPCREAYNPNAPDLAVEVISPTDQEKRMLVKLSNYLASGTTVWIVYPEEREVHIHEVGEAVKIMTVDDTLQTPLLPQFELPVRDIFPEEPEAETE